MIKRFFSFFIFLFVIFFVQTSQVFAECLWFTSTEAPTLQDNKQVWPFSVSSFNQNPATVVHQDGSVGARNIYFSKRIIEKVAIWDNECSNSFTNPPNKNCKKDFFGNYLHGKGKFYLDNNLVYEFTLPITISDSGEIMNFSNTFIADRFEYTPAVRQSGTIDSGGYNVCFSMISNKPPVCEGIEKTPNKDFYLPNELITLKAKSSDPEGLNITYNNWLVSPTRNGSFTTSTSAQTVSFRTSSTPNVTENVTFNVSDGVNYSQCAYPISTRLLYYCDEKSLSCATDSQKGTNTLAECSTNCKTTYSCDANLGCVPVLNSGTYSSKDTCEASCLSKYVSCSSITSQKISNDSYKVVANLKSFSYGKTALLKLVDSLDNSLVFSEAVTLPQSYFEFSKNIFYNTTKPISTELKLFIDGKEVCKTSILNNFNADLSLNFIDTNGSVSPKYYVSPSEEKTTVLKLDYDITGGSIDTYRLTLSCPGLICSFDNGLQTKDFINLSSKSSQSLNVIFKGATEGQYTISALGSSGSSYIRNASAQVYVVAKPSLTVSVKKTNSILSSGENATKYCDTPSSLISLPSKVVFDLENFNLKSSQEIQYPGSFPLPLNLSKYILYTKELSGLTDFEVKCSKFVIKSSTGAILGSQTGVLGNSISFDLNTQTPPFAKTVDVQIVLGNATIGSWFNAIGASSYSALSVKNNVPKMDDYFFLTNSDSPKISAGIAVQKSFEGSVTGNISKNAYINFASSSSQSEFSVLKGYFDNFDKIKLLTTSIKNTDEISFSTNSKVYTYDGSLILNKEKIEKLNVKYNSTSNSVPQILIVKGSVEVQIEKDSANFYTIPLVLVSVKESEGISVSYAPDLFFPKSLFLGGLFSRSFINIQPTQKLLSDNTPAEQIFYFPQIVLSTDPSIKALKETRVYISKID